MNAETHQKADELKAKADQVRQDANNYRVYIRRCNASCRGVGDFASGELGKELLEVVRKAEEKALSQLREQYRKL